MNKTADNNHNITEVKDKASKFLITKKDRNKTTFLNYRTSINYFIYYLTNIANVEAINNDNIENLLVNFQNALLNGFHYKTEASERIVKVKSLGVNTHIRRTKTFLNKCFKLNPAVNKLPVNT